MTRRRALLIAASIVLACLIRPAFVSGVRQVALTLPERLSDREFWDMVSNFSEPNGSFRSDNLLSNETAIQYVIPDLTRIAKPGRVYLGVGPEQNFTYIAALKPAMAFIVDIRRGNLDLHLMYKALFELSADRAEFVSRLFSKKRPDGLGAKSTVAEIFAAYSNVDTSETLYNENLEAIKNQLATRHGFEVSGDLRGIEYVYHAFFTYGPQIQYSSTGSFGGPYQPTYANLMVATDGGGQARGYLSSEEMFQLLKDLQSRNMVVPIVGNFVGPKAIRSVGTYLKGKAAMVSAFYLSNVEQFLYQDGTWRDFCANAASLPLDETSMFIRAVRGGGLGRGMGLNSDLGEMAADLKDCAASRP